MLRKIPNILTIGRIIIVPIFVLTFFIPGFFGDLIPFFLFALASFTDYLDGLLARMFKEESKLGELLDPIADKILVAAALILLVMNGTIKNYEVKEDFKKKFIKKDKKNLMFFKINKKKLYFDLTSYIYTSLKKNGIKYIDVLKVDTFDIKHKFFSARRALKLKHNDYGRNISIIMLN